MRGQPDIGFIQARNEVEPYNEGYRGVVVIAGQGRWQTPEAPTKAAAQILLAELNARLLPAPTASGLSEATATAMSEALASRARSGLPI